MGFGCAGLSGVFDGPVPDEVVISLIKYAFSNGITFFDTSDFYGPYTNEVLVGKVCYIIYDTQRNAKDAFFDHKESYYDSVRERKRISLAFLMIHIYIS